MAAVRHLGLVHIFIRPTGLVMLSFRNMLEDCNTNWRINSRDDRYKFGGLTSSNARVNETHLCTAAGIN